jgi:hypothetical protein
MTRFSSIAMLTAILLATGCTALNGIRSSDATTAKTAGSPAAQSHLPANALLVQDADGSVVVEQVAFQSGVSSATVERLARRFGCIGDNGAGLITEKGPVEIYRMRCENGTTFLAQCEMRQCRPLR